MYFCVPLAFFWDLHFLPTVQKHAFHSKCILLPSYVILEYFRYTLTMKKEILNMNEWIKAHAPYPPGNVSLKYTIYSNSTYVKLHVQAIFLAVACSVWTCPNFSPGIHQWYQKPCMSPHLQCRSILKY